MVNEIDWTHMEEHLDTGEALVMSMMLKDNDALSSILKSFVETDFTQKRAVDLALSLTSLCVYNIVAACTHMEIDPVEFLKESIQVRHEAAEQGYDNLSD